MPYVGVSQLPPTSALVNFQSPNLLACTKKAYILNIGIPNQAWVSPMQSSIRISRSRSFTPENLPELVWSRFWWVRWPPCTKVQFSIFYSHSYVIAPTTRNLNHSIRIQDGVQKCTHHSKTEPFTNQTALDHSSSPILQAYCFSLNWYLNNSSFVTWPE